MKRENEWQSIIFKLKLTMTQYDVLLLIVVSMVEENKFAYFLSNVSTGNLCIASFPKWYNLPLQ